MPFPLYLPPAPPALIALDRKKICKVLPFLCSKPKPPKPPVEVPGPLPVIGAGAAFLWGRKLRARIQEAGK